MWTYKEHGHSHVKGWSRCPEARRPGTGAHKEGHQSSKQTVGEREMSDERCWVSGSETETLPIEGFKGRY